jgi:hypothetical protein
MANCRHDRARDLGLEDHQVRVVCHYMGGGFGNKNQNQDADLIAATLSRHTNAPVMLEYTRRDDWLGMQDADRATVQGRCHQRWHSHRHPAPWLQRHGTLPQEFRGYRRSGTVCLPQSVPLGLSGVHQSHHLGQFPRAV